VALQRREFDVVDDSSEIPDELASLVTGWVRTAPLGAVLLGGDDDPALLPPHEEAIPIAKKFGSLGDLRTFLELYQTIRKQAPDRSDLDLIARGASPFGILRKHYEALPFPAPPQLDGLEDTLDFIPNGRALAEAARRLDNCGRNWIAEALTGHIIFYNVKGDVPAMLSIERDPFGLRMKELKSKGNGLVEFAVARKLQAELSRCGVSMGLSVGDHLSILELGYNENEDAELEMP
jgi:hypothetical protein